MTTGTQVLRPDRWLRCVVINDFNFLQTGLAQYVDDGFSGWLKPTSIMAWKGTGLQWD